MSENYYGYISEDDDQIAHFPSLPGDGDPLFHEPVLLPEDTRHGDWFNYNPDKGSADAKPPVITDAEIHDWLEQGPNK